MAPETFGLYAEGLSLSAELFFFTAVGDTAGAGSAGFGNGAVVACFLYPWNCSFSTESPPKLGW